MCNMATHFGMNIRAYLDQVPLDHSTLSQCPATIPQLCDWRCRIERRVEKEELILGKDAGPRV